MKVIGGMMKGKIDLNILVSVILSITLGLLFTKFLDNTLITEKTLGVGNIQDSKIYILHTGYFYDEQSAQNQRTKMRNLGFQAVIVKEFNRYYVYHEVGTKGQFTTITNKLNELKIEYFIREISFYPLLERLTLIEVDSIIEKDYLFFESTIAYYISMLNGVEVNFSNQYISLVHEGNRALFNELSILKANLYSDLNHYYALMVYKQLIEILL